MGQSKGGGYQKLPTLTDQQSSFLNQLLSQVNPQINQSAQGYSQFLPGGGGGQAFIDAAQQRYKQQTIPSILNALGGDNKGSSALNQALAASAADLNTNLASQLAQMQLNAAGGLGSLGLNQAQLGAQTPQFAYQQKQQPLWQSLLQGLLPVGGQLGGAALSAPRNNFNF